MIKRVGLGFRLFFDRRVSIWPKLLIIVITIVMWLIPDLPGPFDDFAYPFALLAFLEEFSPPEVVEELSRR